MESRVLEAGPIFVSHPTQLDFVLSKRGVLAPG